MKNYYKLEWVNVLISCIFLITGLTAQVTTTTTDTVPPVSTSIDTMPPPPPAETQEEAKGKSDNGGFRIGIRAGVNAAQQDIDQGSISEDPQSKLGADFALVTYFPIGNGVFAFQPELHWLQKGYRIEDAVAVGDISSTLDYLEIPLLLRLNVGKAANIFGFAGPSAGFLLGGTYEDDNGKSDIDTDDYEAIEWSFQAGVGVKFAIFELDVRWMQGLSDVASDDSGVEGVKNKGVGVGLTLMF